MDLAKHMAAIHSFHSAGFAGENYLWNFKIRV